MATETVIKRGRAVVLGDGTRLEAGDTVTKEQEKEIRGLFDGDANLTEREKGDS